MTALRAGYLPTEIPGPAGHPLLGMAPELRRDVLGTLMDGFRRYGDLVSYRIGPARGPKALRRRYVAVYHPDGVHQVLTDRAFGRDGTTFGVLRELIGDGLLTTDGDVWVRQRRTLQPLFTARRVRGYREVMAAEAERVVDDVTRHLGNQVDLHRLMHQYTVRVIGRAVFGDDVEDAIPALLRVIPRAGTAVIDRAMRVLRPPLGLPTPANRRFTAARDEQYAVVDRILARRGERPATPPGDGPEPDAPGDDIVTRLRAARDPATGAPLSDQEIRDQALVILLAGHETSAAALTFTLHLLGRHPEVQDRVAEAARAPESDEPSRNLLNATLSEGLRLRPPAYMTERRAHADTEIGGWFIPRGSMVLVSPWVTHRHPEFWPEPDVFRPERFLGPQDRPRYAYFPFGGGPRHCIGEHFAMLESEVLLRAILSRFRLTAVEEDLRLVPLITMRPAAAYRSCSAG